MFDSGEITKSVTMFEKEVGQKLGAETRHQIVHSSQGFPWLIKKLCINLFEGMTKGEGSESLFVDLDVGRLFESDLISLSTQEMTCLKMVAQKAPADWSEIIEIAGTSVLNNLIHKRLVIKSGDRLNIYWDIFKDYLLTGKVPVVPFNYIPTNELPSALKLCERLVSHKFLSAPQLGKIMNLNERTIWNIGADLVMFGLAERAGTSFKLHYNIQNYGQETALRILRDKMNKHSFKISLYRKYASKSIDNGLLREVLESCLPKARFSDKTWTTYTSRLTNLLVYTGYLTRAGHSVIVQDLGTPPLNANGTLKRRRARGAVFSISVSPYIVLDTMQRIETSNGASAEFNRNPLSVLKRFDLIVLSDTTPKLNHEAIYKYGGNLEAIWSLAKNEPSLARCVEILGQNPNISPKDLAKEISNKYQMYWADGSLIRNGNILKQWSGWIKEGIDTSKIPTPPGRPVSNFKQPELDI